MQTFLSDVVAIVGRELLLYLMRIDWDMSRDEHRICMQSGIDDQIDKHREDYAGKLKVTSFG